MPDRPTPAAALRSAVRTVMRRMTGHGRIPEDPGTTLYSCSRVTLSMPEAEHPADAFRRVMAVFPTAVTVVTSLDADGDPRGLTCSAVASVSADPPLVAVCVNQRNGSLTAIRDSGGFALNLLAAGSAHVSDTFASPSPAKFRSVRWRPTRVTGLPWLAHDTAAMLDCRLAADVEVATHAVLVGLVVDSAVGRCADGPLMYWQRAYGGWSPAVMPPDAAPAPAPARTAAGAGSHAR